MGTFSASTICTGMLVVVSKVGWAAVVRIVCRGCCAVKAWATGVVVDPKEMMLDALGSVFTNCDADRICKWR